jgi:hypothetical protein
MDITLIFNVLGKENSNQGNKFYKIQILGLIPKKGYVLDYTYSFFISNQHRLGNCKMKEKYLTLESYNLKEDLKYCVQQDNYLNTTYENVTILIKNL